MAEKNIKLKNGEDIVYPQTKIGNILNDDIDKSLHRFLCMTEHYDPNHIQNYLHK